MICRRPVSKARKRIAAYGVSRPVRLHCCYLLVLFLSLPPVTAAEPARGRPMLYNYVSEGGSEGNRILRQTYGGRYNIVPAAQASGLVPPKLTLQTYPLYGRVPGGSGRVLVAFIVAPNGRVKDPVVLHSTQARNDRMVREMVSKWLWQPARLNGAPVASIVSRDIGFGRARRSVGFSRPRR